jgi:hypothetical protein
MELAKVDGLLQRAQLHVSSAAKQLEEMVVIKEQEDGSSR